MHVSVHVCPMPSHVRAVGLCSSQFTCSGAVKQACIAVHAVLQAVVGAATAIRDAIDTSKLAETLIAKSSPAEDLEAVRTRKAAEGQRASLTEALLKACLALLDTAEAGSQQQTEDVTTAPSQDVQDDSFARQARPAAAQIEEDEAGKTEENGAKLVSQAAAGPPQQEQPAGDTAEQEVRQLDLQEQRLCLLGHVCILLLPGEFALQDHAHFSQAASCHMSKQFWAVSPLGSIMIRYRSLVHLLVACIKMLLSAIMQAAIICRVLPAAGSQQPAEGGIC